MISDITVAVLGVHGISQSWTGMLGELCVAGRIVLGGSPKLVMHDA